MKQNEIPICPNCNEEMVAERSKTASGFGAPRTKAVRFRCPKCQRFEDVQITVEPPKKS